MGITRETIFPVRLRIGMKHETYKKKWQQDLFHMTMFGLSAMGYQLWAISYEL